jgi:hypothetical protein
MHKRLITIAATLWLGVGFVGTASAQLAGRSAEEWIRTLETPTRVTSLKVPRRLRP